MDVLNTLEGYWLSLIAVITLVVGFAAAWVIVACYYEWTKRHPKPKAEGHPRSKVGDK